MPVKFKPGVKFTAPGTPRLFAEDYMAADFPVQIYHQDYTNFNAPMYVNDQLGDCVPAGMGHSIGAWTKYGQGVETLFSDNQIIGLYSAVGGYVPGDPNTDQGTDPATALAYMRSHGLAGHKIDAYAQIRNLTWAGLTTALKLYGSVGLAVNLPQSAEDQFNYGLPWTVDRSSPILGGHWITLQGFMPGMNSGRVATWGEPGHHVQMAWWNHYGVEAWAMYSRDFMAPTGTAPNGLNEAALLADMAEL